MSGHNKFSKIKHKKAASDAAKSKIFTKISMLITSESKKSGGDVNSPGLVVAIESAKKANMPKDTIERAIKKGLGADATTLESITYEAYGPGGCAIIIEVLTDNRNKSAAEIRHILSKSNIELAQPGSAIWAFQKDGKNWNATTQIELSDDDLQKVVALLEGFDENEDVQNVFTNISNLEIE